MNFQLELGQPRLELPKESVGIVPMLESRHEIIGIADNYHVPPCHFLAPDLYPQIEDVV
jgi:hypothetical protein